MRWQFCQPHKNIYPSFQKHFARYIILTKYKTIVSLNIVYIFKIFDYVMSFSVFYFTKKHKNKAAVSERNYNLYD